MPSEEINLKNSDNTKMSLKNRLHFDIKSKHNFSIRINNEPEIPNRTINTKKLGNIEKTPKKLIKEFLAQDSNYKIHEQLMKNIEGIEEQEKLTTRRSNRVIRAYIQKCKEQLNKRLKEEDIPSDKIISLEKFEKIMEETGLQFKEEHLKILLYQMKKAVPKGRNFNTLNAIVIVDFLK